MEHELRRQIILRLIHNPRLSYNQLWNKEGESNLFAYHLKKMEEEGVIRKFDDGYGLTAEGKQLSAFIEGDTGGKAALPTPTVLIFARKGDLLCAQERLKEPFFGYWSWPSGKINFGWNPRECAIRDLKEETDLVAHDMVLRAIEHIKTFDNGKLIHHHLMWVYETRDFSGTLKESTHKARNKFMTLDEYKSSKRFPGDWLLDRLWTNDSMYIIDVERNMKDGVFQDYNVVSSQEFKTG